MLDHVLNVGIPKRQIPASLSCVAVGGETSVRMDRGSDLEESSGGSMNPDLGILPLNIVAS